MRASRTRLPRARPAVKKKRVLSPSVLRVAESESEPEPSTRLVAECGRPCRRSRCRLERCRPRARVAVEASERRARGAEGERERGRTASLGCSARPLYTHPGACCLTASHNGHTNRAASRTSIPPHAAHRIARTQRTRRVARREDGWRLPHRDGALCRCTACATAPFPRRIERAPCTLLQGVGNRMAGPVLDLWATKA
jgi:hypothetical protein